ncbi:hypothetical protein PtA15_10A111 [Puccinia triticina]|uniref:Uncharacterized protein n=1 Tax=Puccinia triticina TaxID=208348 RepID=A0ABY7D152_9BASI|nr:uncharacterized protein PtA15_10A111 [Puccinia triticina]WAQ88692.1 hypothetical protein PtA15_10A111 [Puccinia triticina]
MSQDHIALARTPANLSRLAANQNQKQITKVFTTTYLRADSTAHSDLLKWLLSTDKQQTTTTDKKTTTSSSPILRQGQPIKRIKLDARDEDRSPAIILAAAFGHAEEVSVIVDGLTDQVVNRRDAGQSYTRQEPLLKELTEPHTQLHLEELVNRIYVFIIQAAAGKADQLDHPRL